MPYQQIKFFLVGILLTILNFPTSGEIVDCWQKLWRFSPTAKINFTWWGNSWSFFWTVKNFPTGREIVYRWQKRSRISPPAQKDFFVVKKLLTVFAIYRWWGNCWPFTKMVKNFPTETERDVWSKNLNAAIDWIECFKCCGMLSCIREAHSIASSSRGTITVIWMHCPFNQPSHKGRQSPESIDSFSLQNRWNFPSLDLTGQL